MCGLHLELHASKQAAADMQEDLILQMIVARQVCCRCFAHDIAFWRLPVVARHRQQPGRQMGLILGEFMIRWECLGMMLALCWLRVGAPMGCIASVIFAAASTQQGRFNQREKSEQTAVSHGSCRCKRGPLSWLRQHCQTQTRVRVVTRHGCGVRGCAVGE